MAQNCPLFHQNRQLKLNTLGHLFRFTSFGESHGPAIGGVIDGCPAGLTLDFQAIQHELDRRKPGQSAITTQRKEEDTFTLLSGIMGNKTLGSPIAFMIPNRDQRESDYDHLEDAFRPSHADYTYYKKYGLREHKGGGRSSARVTAGWVFAGAVARQLLAQQCAMEFEAWVSRVGALALPHDFIPPANWEAQGDEAVKMLRCPDPLLAGQMKQAIETAQSAGDSLGGCISGRIKKVPAGLGEPLFAKTHAMLGHAFFSINAVKGVEFGAGFGASQMRGTQHNDLFISVDGNIHTQTNRSGGIQGGITNGEEVTFTIAFKPPSTISVNQTSVNQKGEPTTIAGKGRHDPCVLPRAVPIVEAMAALVMADLFLIARASING